MDEFIEALTTPLKAKTRAAVLKHPLHKFRLQSTTQLVEYNWSGYVFAFEIPAFLASRSIQFADYISKRESKRLTASIGMPVDVFTSTKSRKLAAELDVQLDNPNLASEIETFLKKYPKSQPRTDPKLSPRAVIDGILVLRYWLTRIGSSEYGLLEVST